MKARIRVLAVSTLLVALAFGTAILNAANMTLTGEVGDAMCGVKHMMKDAAACTAACVGKGADYALIVGDKAYTLKANAAQRTELSKMAGKMATINGDVNGTTITVASVKMAAR